MKILYLFTLILCTGFSYSQTLMISRNVIDYGKISKGENGVKKVEIKNTGDKPLIISNVKSTCGCTIPSWPKEPIAPGKSDYITISYDTQKLGPIQKTIEVFSNDTKYKRKAIRIIGNVN